MISRRKGFNQDDSKPVLKRHGEFKLYGQSTAITVPVPECPESGAYPGSVLTMTSSTLLPEMRAWSWLIELETITAMYVGTLSGGCELLPAVVDQVLPQVAGPLGLSAKPLKSAGPVLPANGMADAHWAPQNVADEPRAA